VKFTTPDGGSVEITRIAHAHDVQLRNAAGETTATVRMTHAEALALVYKIHHGAS
jgi:hypothetical protein